MLVVAIQFSVSRKSQDEPGRGMYLFPAHSDLLVRFFLSLHRPCWYDFSADIHLRIGTINALSGPHISRTSCWICRNRRQYSARYSESLSIRRLL